MVYSFYLSASKDGGYYPDYLTYIVAKQSSAVIEFIGYESTIAPHEDNPSLKLFVNSVFTVEIIEGCNAISVIILFMSFVISFSERFNKTFLFLLMGALLLYVVNLIRIVVLTIVYYEYPDYQETLHNIVFPAIIYGMVLLLWMKWVKSISIKTNTND